MPAFVNLLLWTSTLLPFFASCLFVFYKPARSCGARCAALLLLLALLTLAFAPLWSDFSPGQSLLSVAVTLAILLLYAPIISLLLHTSVLFVLYCVLPGINAAAALGFSILALNGFGTPEPYIAALAILACFLLCLCCIRILRAFLLPFRNDVTARELLYFSASPMVFLAIMLLSYAGGGEYPLLQIAVLALSLLGTYFIYYLGGKLFSQRLGNLQSRQRSVYLEHCIQLQQTQYIALGEQLKQAHAAEHDLRHHIHALERYLRDGNRDKLCEYLPFMKEQLELLHTELGLCANSAVDAVARHYIRQAQDLGAQLDVQMDMGEDFSIPAFDLCIVVGNYLENAVEALRSVERGRRSIRLRARQDNEMFTLVAANSFAGELDVQDGVYLSTKRKNQPGIGLSSINAIAKKYGGTCEIEAAAGTFKLSLVLFGQKDSKP